MTTDYSFLKIYHGDRQPAAAANKLLAWLDEAAASQGLRSVEGEQGAHFSVMLIEGETAWLHLDTMGHFLPQSSTTYATVPQLLSLEHSVVDFRGSDGGPYVLRRFSNKKVTARYAVYGNDGRFESLAAAEPWNPVFADWEGLLSPDVDANDFYRLLPPPRHPDTPTPTVMTDYFDLPEHFNKLFGWYGELNYACIEFPPDGPLGRGDFYEPESGDYVDRERDLRIYVRHYMHPQGNRDHAVVGGE